MLHPSLIQELHGKLFGQWKPSWEEMRSAVHWSKVNDKYIGDFSSVRAGACDYLKGLYVTHLETQQGLMREVLTKNKALQRQVRKQAETIKDCHKRTAELATTIQDMKNEIALC